VYVGIRDVIDPVRVRFELQDSRRYGSGLPESTSTVNEFEVQQLLLELYYDDVLGAPFSLRVGRHSFDLVDRRLVTRNRFGNTANAFDGVRLRLGDEASPVEVNAFAFMPPIRRTDSPDIIDDEALFAGAAVSIRTWSPAVTLEPYVYSLTESERPERETNRDFVTAGVHIFGDIGATRWDYDVDMALQTGEVDNVGHDARGPGILKSAIARNA
jgi:hypothetical protein